VIMQSAIVCNVITHSLSDSLLCACTGTEKLPIHSFGHGAHLSACSVVLGAISPRVKWPESEANQSPLPSAEPRMGGAKLLLLFCVFMACT
jgi:hypothetical protein